MKQFRVLCSQYYSDEEAAKKAFSRIVLINRNNNITILIKDKNTAVYSYVKTLSLSDFKEAILKLEIQTRDMTLHVGDVLEQNYYAGITNRNYELPDGKFSIHHKFSSEIPSNDVPRILVDMFPYCHKAIAAWLAMAIRGEKDDQSMHLVQLTPELEELLMITFKEFYVHLNIDEPKDNFIVDRRLVSVDCSLFDDKLLNVNCVNSPVPDVVREPIADRRNYIVYGYKDHAGILVRKTTMNSVDITSYLLHLPSPVVRINSSLIRYLSHLTEPPDHSSYMNWCRERGMVAEKISDFKELIGHLEGG